MAEVARGVAEGEVARDEPRDDATYRDDVEFVPVTEFGRRLLELRRRIIAKQGLLDAEGLEREIAERRGGLRVGDER